jgi:Fe-S-cluster-containing dehydrogenase component/Ni,Fe-hydrogenase III small subunit
MVRWGMVIDLRKCIGCQACTVACKAENLAPQGVHWNRVLKIEEGKYPNVRRLFLPLPCMHCEDPGCVAVCPTGASYKRPDGIVMIDHGKCIGCMYCIGACPYGVRTYIDEAKPYFPNAGLSQIEQYRDGEHQNGVVEKCNFCVERVENGLEPACVQTCPPKARYFGDLDDPESEVSRIIKAGNAVQLLRESGTNPSVYYIRPPNTSLDQFSSSIRQLISRPALQRPPFTLLAREWFPWIAVVAALLGSVPLAQMYDSRRKRQFVEKARKLRLAIVECALCDVCKTTLADLGRDTLSLISRGVVLAPVMTNAIGDEPVDVALVVGSVRTEEDLRKVKKVREKARLLVAYGACPVFGLLPAGEAVTSRLSNPTSSNESSNLVNEIRPLSDYVKVDLIIPGCPPPLQVIRDTLDEILYRHRQE